MNAFILVEPMRVWVWKFLGAEALPGESRKKLAVVALLYFIQGAPAAILWEVLPVYFRIHGVSLRALGGLRLDVDQGELSQLLLHGPLSDGGTDVAARANDCDLRTLDHGGCVIRPLQKARNARTQY